MNPSNTRTPSELFDEMQPDYNASVYDHGAISIAICRSPLSGVSSKFFEKVTDKIGKYRELNVSGRRLRVRYVRERGIVGEWLAASNWGDLQLYRRPLGLIYLAECKSPMDVALVVQAYRDIRKKLGASVFDGRCLIFRVATELMAQNQTDILQFGSVDGWKTSWQDIEDLVTQVYYILESKRVEKSKLNQIQLEKMPLLAPFERKSTSVIDIESRSFRKKQQGRLKKHIGDLCLLAGLPQEALTAYNSALENLRVSQDHLWVASCLESLCAVTSVYKLDTAYTDTKSSILKLCLETPSDIFEKYREAVINYSKYKEAGVLELEACLKATKILAKFGHRLEASDFLQNTIYIGIKLEPDREIERLSTLAELYGEIGFKRKEAFYKRVAAMYCVQEQLKTGPRWNECYSLLTQALVGFNLASVSKFIAKSDSESADSETSSTMSVLSDPAAESERSGWPAVQARVLHELAFSARKMGNTRLAVKLLSGLLHNTHQYLNKSEQVEMLMALENYSKALMVKHQDTDESLREAATLPLFCNIQFQVCNGDTNLVPQDENPSGGTSVFIYSPYESDKPKATIKWCASESNSIIITFRNPLSAPLTIKEASLIIEGEIEPSIESVSFELDECSKKDVEFVCTCASTGSFNVVGYVVVLYGLTYKVYFNELLKYRRELKMATTFPIDIIEAIPALDMNFILETAPLDCSVRSEQNQKWLEFIDGEERPFTLELENTSTLPVKWVDITTAPKEPKPAAQLTVNFGDVCQTIAPGAKMIIGGNVFVQLNTSAKLAKSVYYVDIRYKDACDNNLYRMSRLTINLTVKCELDVIGLCVKQANTSDVATAVFELRNKSTQDFHIIQSNKDKPSNMAEMIVTPKKPAVLNVQMEKLENIPISDKMRDTSGLGLRWANKVQQRGGVLRLPNETFNPADINQLQSSPLYWETECNGVTLEVEDVEIGTVKELISLKTAATNRTSVTYKNVQIVVEAYQEDSIGEFKLYDGTILWLGNNKTIESSLEAQESMHFAPGFLSLQTGSFKLRFAATFTDLNGEKTAYSPSYTFNIEHPNTAL